MAKRRTPPRYKSGPKKGQFMSKRARRRKRRPARRNPGRTVARRRKNPPRRRRRRAAVRRRAPARKRRYRRNAPRRMNVVDTLMDGFVEAGQVLVGKAAVRSIPDLVGAPKQGNMGLAVQVGTALVIGFASEMFFSKRTSQAMVAGALTAPLETLIVAQDIPWLGRALSPVTAVNGMNAYVMGGNGRLGRYVRRRAITPASSAGLGRYAVERGMGYH